MSRKKCIIVAGPTAAGKTALAIETALKHNTQIISADSRQCFRELGTGVAKPTGEQLQKVRHYFINSHSIFEDVNARLFETYALEAAAEIFKKNDIAVMVGGTGLYIRAFTEGLDAVPDVEESIHEEVQASYRSMGIGWLRAELEKRDPVFFQLGEMQNPRRMLRALEVHLSTGRSLLDFHSREKASRPFDIQVRLLDVPRQQLYRNINNRVDQMMQDGLLKEAGELYAHRHLNALQTVGYKELFNYLEGKISLEKAVEEIKKNTRHYAKRQITWFSKYL